MALKESDMRRQVVRALSALHAVPIENVVGVGTPDVEYIGGWLELKSVDLPSNPDAPVRVPHFTAAQRLWLRQRREAGGRADVLVKAGQWWIFLRGDIAAEVLGYVTVGRLIDEAIDAWTRVPTGDELIPCLMKTLPRRSVCGWCDSGSA